MQYYAPEGDAPPGTQMTVTVIDLEHLRDDPAWVKCTFCNEVAKTRLDKGPSSTTLLAAIACCFAGVICSAIPFCFKYGYDVDHYCTKCSNRLTHRSYGDAKNQVLTPPVLQKVTVQTEGPAPAK
ncbi:hypothetical protein BT63DRAFT_429600 [Microthyrium microscopicum]|uniref:LITAF domain-containing protein n=1 Tax=Microthyrium microscopicum TaxID=703497 RepID=A0A6A6TVG1_9PEZI|nr:hypothetical protein BT63DRAFT_429600 [Microthyrium microscopicum]